jgi:hypothetical protein
LKVLKVAAAKVVMLLLGLLAGGCLVFWLLVDST